MRRPYLAMLATLPVALAILTGWFLAMVGTATPVGAATLCAPSLAYTTIQAAINAAGDGDTVQIVYGTWYENLDITDDITLEGGYTKECGARTHPDPQYTIIDGGAADHVVEITGGSTVTLDGLTLTNGRAQKGGGVYVSGASADLNNVVVTENMASPAGSGSSQWGYGGGVYVYKGTIRLTDCEITHNTSDPTSSDVCFGGGLALVSEALDPAIAIIQGTHIMSNTNPSDSDPDGSTLYGGGLYLDPQSQVTFDGIDNLIAYNEARAGGGVYMYGDVDLEGVLIWGNYASWDGGGLYLASGYNGGRIANNYLGANTANREGASLVAGDVNVEIANNTIVGDFTGGGAGIYVADTGSGVLELANNIVVNHTVGIERSTTGSASVTLSHNDVWNNTTNYINISAASSDISVDPGFVDPGNSDYHLTADSPCVNAGEYIDWLFLDYDGERRTGTWVDIGADEYGSDYLQFVPAALKRYTP